MTTFETFCDNTQWWKLWIHFNKSMQSCLRKEFFMIRSLDWLQTRKIRIDEWKKRSFRCEKYSNRLKLRQIKRKVLGKSCEKKEIFINSIWKEFKKRNCKSQKIFKSLMNLKNNIKRKLLNWKRNMKWP